MYFRSISAKAVQRPAARPLPAPSSPPSASLLLCSVQLQKPSCHLRSNSTHSQAQARSRFPLLHHLRYTTMAKPINRITLFKVPNADNIPAILEKYTTLTTDAKKDSKPYIISAKANAVIPDPAGRNQGFTIAANTVFASLDDMKFYDEDCEAHKAIKAFLKPRIEGVMTVYHEAD